MKQGFQSVIAEVITIDFRNFKLLKEIIYFAVDSTVYILPAGASSDLISSPREVWSVRPPFGNDALAGFGHDCAYRNTLLIQLPDGSRKLANLPKDKCDSLIREMAISLGDTDFQADELYYGVKDFGWRSFDEDRA